MMFWFGATIILREGSGYQIGGIFGKIPNGPRPPPPPSFWENHIAIFYNGYGRSYARRHRPDSTCSYRLISLNINTIVEKTYPEPWNYSSYQFHAQKALFKVPKICNITFWIENDQRINIKVLCCLNPGTGMKKRDWKDLKRQIDFQLDILK